jgi:hypothetical protein
MVDIFMLVRNVTLKKPNVLKYLKFFSMKLIKEIRVRLGK